MRIHCGPLVSHWTLPQALKRCLGPLSRSHLDCTRAELRDIRTVATQRQLVALQAIATPDATARASGQPLQQQSHFLSSEFATFESLSLPKEVSLALDRAGYSVPAHVQVLAARPLLMGRDVVLAAETGSGKTLAYLGPIMSRLIIHKLTAQQVGQSQPVLTPGALILCPNLPLCDQVVAMANQIVGSDGQPLVHTVRISSSQPPPRQLPDITVATPAGLIHASDNYGHHYGPAWTRDSIVDRMRYVVFDEADLLLTGGFEKDVGKLRQALQESDRFRLTAAACRELGIDESQYRALPMHIRRAGAHGGASAMRTAGFKPKHAVARPPPASQASADLVWDDAPSTSTSSAQQSSPQLTQRGSETTSTSHSEAEPYWRRQYIFAAATMPSGDAGKSVGADLRQMVPDAVWLNGAALHRAQSRVSHRWLPVSEDTWASALQQAVADHPKSEIRRTIVFTADVASADEAAAVLRAAGLQPLVYHRKMSAEERAHALEAMSTRAECIMVCTDSAARGLDIPHVTHVVQATFAAAAVDFLHRVGRTGRAGNAGHVTSLYLPQQALLAEAIHAEIEAGRPIEGTFSRNRSLRSKYKRYGRFVPRGEIVNNL